MSISRQNLSIVIVTFKSEAVIHECIKSIDKDIKIIVIENSNNKAIYIDIIQNKDTIRTCVLSYDNLGMGRGNNFGIKKTETDFVLILNPDVILEPSTINELIKASQEISNFAIIAPISSDINYPNYKLHQLKKIIITNEITTLKKVCKV